MSMQRLLGTELPIVQAPMAGMQGSALAVAVSNAGGLGSLPCALLEPDAMRAELEAIRAQTTKPFNVNFFCHTPPVFDAERDSAWRELLAPYYQECGIDPEPGSPIEDRTPVSMADIDLLEEFRPAVVSFHFGLPSSELLDRLRRFGTKVLSTATTVEEARWLEAQGVDAVIAQGLDAGGHRGMFLSDDLAGQAGTLSLVPQIVRAVDVPVIAAGGIASAERVAAAMAVGAAGVQIGTAYLLCPEVRTSPLHRAALKSDASRNTALTRLFTGRPARSIVNRIMRELEARSTTAPAFPLAVAALALLWASAEPRGISDFSPLWCGENASGCKEIPAAELTRELACGL